MKDNLTQEEFNTLKQEWLDRFSEMSTYDLDLYFYIKMKGYLKLTSKEFYKLANQGLDDG